MSDSREQFERYMKKIGNGGYLAMNEDGSYMSYDINKSWKDFTAGVVASRAQPERKLTDAEIAAMVVASANDLTTPKLADDEIVDICDSRGWTQYSAPTLQQIAHAFYAEGCAAQRRALLAAQPASDQGIKDSLITGAQPAAATVPDGWPSVVGPSLLRPAITGPGQLPEGCFCPPGQCGAPVIMGRQMACRRIPAAQAQDDGEKKCR